MKKQNRSKYKVLLDERYLGLKYEIDGHKSKEIHTPRAKSYKWKKG